MSLKERHRTHTGDLKTRRPSKLYTVIGRKNKYSIIKWEIQSKVLRKAKRSKYNENNVEKSLLAVINN